MLKDIISNKENEKKPCHVPDYPIEIHTITARTQECALTPTISSKAPADVGINL